MTGDCSVALDPGGQEREGSAGCGEAGLSALQCGVEQGEWIQVGFISPYVLRLYIFYILQHSPPSFLPP